TTHDTLDPLLDAGQTVTIADVHTDPRVPPGLRAIQERDGRPALAMIPLIVRGERTGLVVLSSPAVHAWREADLRPYQVTPAQLAPAADSPPKQAMLHQHAQQLAVWQERHRPARELPATVS